MIIIQEEDSCSASEISGCDYKYRCRKQTISTRLLTLVTLFMLACVGEKKEGNLIIINCTSDQQKVINDHWIVGLLLLLI